MLENIRPEIKKVTKKKKIPLNTHLTNLHQQYCTNKTISNIVLDVIWSRLTNNHIIMIRQESKLLRPSNTEDPDL